MLKLSFCLSVNPKVLNAKTQSRKKRKENQKHFEKCFKTASFCVFLGVFPFVLLSVFALRFLFFIEYGDLR